MGMEYLKTANAAGTGDPVSASNPVPVSVISAAGMDRELVVSTYLAKNAFTGASVGDTITATQVLDVSGAVPVSVATIWRNQTTAADLAGAPSAANLTLLASNAVTDAQMASRGYALDGTDATGVTAPTGGVGIRGWLSGIFGKLPASLGAKTAATSLSVTLASDQATVPVSTIAVRGATTVSIANAASVSGAADLGNNSLIGFLAPAAWTAAALNIEVSVDNTNWVTLGLYDATGVTTGSYSSLVAGAAYGVDVQTLLPFRYVRLRSGTSVSPVNQGAQRDFTIVTRPLA